MSCLIVAAVALSPTRADAQIAARHDDTPARAWILVDHDTGAIISADNDRIALPPASLTKLMTALVVENELPPDRPVVVSRRAADTPPTKLNIVEGEHWSRDALLNAMLLASSNDTAIALGENTAGSLTDFSDARQSAARDLGLGDSPTFNDPSGLDSPTESHAGGDLVSARDMAIIARSVLATPELAEIVARPRYDFVAPNGTQRYVKNHNKMLATYPGMIGIKTGYTNRAQHTFAGAATRNGRTLIVVVLGAPSPYPLATKLLDEGFATPAPTDAEVLQLRTLDSVRTLSMIEPVSSNAQSPAAITAALMATAFVAMRTRSNRLRSRRHAAAST